MKGFVVTFPSTHGVPGYLVDPSRLGWSPSSRGPWARATFVATVFPNPVQAHLALLEVREAIRYMAPEINGGLERRLMEAKVVPIGSLSSDVGLHFA